MRRKVGFVCETQASTCQLQMHFDIVVTSCTVLCRAAVWELFMSQRILESEDGLSIGQMFYMIAYQVRTISARCGCICQGWLPCMKQGEL